MNSKHFIAVASCPGGWTSIGSGCYQFKDTTELSYTDAVSSCSSVGGYLFVPNDNEERTTIPVDSFVVDVVGNYYMWIGCTDEAVEGTFQCADGTQLDLNLGKNRPLLSLVYLLIYIQSLD